MRTLSVTDISALFHAFPSTSPQVTNSGRTFRQRRESSGPALSLMCGNRDNNPQMGIGKEFCGIEMYSLKTGNRVTRRNDVNLKKRISFSNGEYFDLVGRLDGVCDEKGIIVEHKYRVHGLLGYVPFHESVQCHMYMHITGLNCAHLVETFGNRLKVHHIPFSDRVWARIMEVISCGRNLNQITSEETEESTNGRDTARKEL